MRLGRLGRGKARGRLLVPGNTLGKETLLQSRLIHCGKVEKKRWFGL